MRGSPLNDQTSFYDKGKCRKTINTSPSITIKSIITSPKMTNHFETTVCKKKNQLKTMESSLVAEITKTREDCWNTSYFSVFRARHVIISALKSSEMCHRNNFLVTAARFVIRNDIQVSSLKFDDYLYFVVYLQDVSKISPAANSISGLFLWNLDISREKPWERDWGHLGNLYDLPKPLRACAPIH